MTLNDNELFEQCEVGEKFQCSQGFWWLKFSPTKAAYDWELNEAIKEKAETIAH